MDKPNACCPLCGASDQIHAERDPALGRMWIVRCECDEDGPTASAPKLADAIRAWEASVADMTYGYNLAGCKDCRAAFDACPREMCPTCVPTTEAA